MDVFGIGVTLYEAMADDWCFDPDLPAADRPRARPLPDSPTGELVARNARPGPGRPPGHLTPLWRAFGRDRRGRGSSPPWPEWIRDRLTPTSARAPG